MKNNRGKILLIFLILFSYLTTVDAKDKEYIWSASINKKSAFVNEAIYLKYICEFEHRAELYVIDFTPKSTNKYKIISLSQTHKLKDNKRIQIYEYIVFAKVAGDLEFDFDVSMKKTNKDSIVNGILGRDNLQFEEFSIEVLKQKKLYVKIKKTTSKLVGKIDLEVKKDKPKVKAYEPYHMNIIIKGLGDLDTVKEFDFSGVDAKVFASEAKKTYTLTKEGYKGVWSQKFAFVSDKDFKIPKVELEYLDIKTQNIKILSQKEVNVEVTKAYTQEELLDEVDDNSFEMKNEYFYYLLSFIAGFLIAKIKFNFGRNNLENEDSFSAKVKNAKTLEELHMLIILQNTNKYKELIADIETGKLNALNEVKKLLQI